MDRFLSAIFNWGLRRMDGAKPEDRQHWIDSLSLPLPGRVPDRVSPSVVKAEMSAFRQLQAEI